MVANLVGVVLVVTCAWGRGLHETRLGGGSRHKARPTGRQALRCDVRFRTPGFICCRNMRKGQRPLSVAGPRLFVVTGLVWKGDKKEMRRESPFLQYVPTYASVCPCLSSGRLSERARICPELNPSNSFGVRARQLTELPWAAG